MENRTPKLQQNLWMVSLVSAPLFIAVAQFFWRDGMLTTTAGVLQVIAFVFWIFAFQAMFDQLKTDLPRFAVLGFAISVYACIGGNNFGVDGIYTEAMGLDSLEAVNRLQEQIGFPTAVYLFIPGSLFPLSLIVLGIQLLRTKKVSTLAGLLLCFGGLGFPLSRIPRIDLLAHIDNILLLAALVLIAIEISRKNQVEKNQ